MRWNRGNVLGAASRSQLVPICLTLCRVGEQQLLTRGAPRRHSRRRERAHTRADDDNHGKTGRQRTRVHRNSEREDVNGETGRNTRRRPKITDVVVRGGGGDGEMFARATLLRESGVRAQVDLALV